MPAQTRWDRRGDAERISAEHGHKPWISLTCDGFADKVNPESVADLAEQVRHRSG